MRILVSLIVALITLASCGGGSNDPKSSIEGTWKGDLLQGGALCSDGTFIGAGSGTVVDKVNLEINGSDVIGSAVKVSDDSCILEGVRDAEGFTASPTQGCEAGLLRMTFKVVNEDEAFVAYNPVISSIEEGSQEVRCDITPSGSVYRN